MIEASRIAEVLGVKAKSIQDLSHAIERGLPKQALTRTANRLFAERGAARRFASQVVPEAAFKRRVRLSVNESERTERIARVVAAAEYVWDDRDEAREWLSTPHPELGNRSPLESSMTELGARRVETILDGIFYGIPA